MLKVRNLFLFGCILVACFLIASLISNEAKWQRNLNSLQVQKTDRKVSDWNQQKTDGKSPNHSNHWNQQKTDGKVSDCNQQKTDGKVSDWNQQKTVGKSLNHSNHWNQQKTDGKLSNIFKGTGTDKRSTHHYDRFYEVFLSPYRTVNNLNFLEIGADQGQSMIAWAKYFPEAELIEGVRYGVATDSQKLACESIGLGQDCPHIKIVDGDQNDPVFLKTIAKESWDVIIDDGSHLPNHQIRSFFYLFPSVRPGGLYVIEDLETNYWKSPNMLYNQKFSGSGVGKDYPGNSIGLFVDLITVMNRKYHSTIDRTILAPEVDDQIAAMMFVPNAILIFKKDTEFGIVGRTFPSRDDSDDEAFGMFVDQAKEKVRKII